MRRKRKTVTARNRLIGRLPPGSLLKDGEVVTVRYLINRLLKFDPNSELVFRDYDDAGCVVAGKDLVEIHQEGYTDHRISKYVFIGFESRESE